MVDASVPQNTAAMEHTGERMVPEASEPRTFWEHIYRYRFATRFVKGKRTLDIACGEGYGSAALLQAGVASLVGVDISQETCDHARKKYGIDARVGDATAIPLPDGSIDTIISFETIEHVAEPEKFLEECYRVLAPGGRIVVSTPNRETFRELDPGHLNPFHCSEMDRPEFESVIHKRFEACSMYYQLLRDAPWYDLRGMAVESWRWWHVKGSRFLGRKARAQFPTPVFQPLSPSQREMPQKLILETETRSALTFNPYVVRPVGRLLGENPVYYVAVAQKRGDR